MPLIAEAIAARRRALTRRFLQAALFTLRRAQDFATRRRRSRARGLPPPVVGQRGAALSWAAPPPYRKQKGKSSGKHGPPRAPKRRTFKKLGPGTPKL